MIVLIDKGTKKVEIYKVKADVCRKLDISHGTLWNWSKNKSHETPTYIILFDCVMFKNKTLRRNTSFYTPTTHDLLFGV